MDVLLHGAAVMDGTGTPAASLDVEIAGDQIVRVGPDLVSQFPRVDLAGLVLSPGFIDPHTHYDAQILWDPDLTPSSWYGVTTVVMGNCGFTIAPTRPTDRDTIVRTMQNVEGMQAATLNAGLPWTFETFPEYLAAIDALGKRVNVACMIGHTPLRWYVMGDDATERQAKPDEIEQMCHLVREALEHGAIGFSSSQSEHIGAYGKPVPSRSATHEELFEIARTIGIAGQGTIEIVIGDNFAVENVEKLVELSGGPVTWSGRVILPTEADEDAAADEAVRITTRSGRAVFPQFACLPIVSQVTLLEPGPLKSVSPGFREILGLDAELRLERYRDDDWRRRAKASLDPKWARRIAAATVQETGVHARLVGGPTLGELAAEQGTTAFDLMIDLALADQLATRFRVATTNTLEAVVERMLQDERAFLGLSDAGAHVTQMCDANYALHLLGYWVRERQALSLEKAVWRLTGHPAEVFGLSGRGRIAPGYAADLVAFDSARVGTGALRRVWDFPDRTDRLVSDGVGVEYVWVNGELIRSPSGDIDSAKPGRLLSSARRLIPPLTPHDNPT